MQVTPSKWQPSPSVGGKQRWPTHLCSEAWLCSSPWKLVNQNFESIGKSIPVWFGIWRNGYRQSDAHRPWEQIKSMTFASLAAWPNQSEKSLPLIPVAQTWLCKDSDGLLGVALRRRPGSRWNALSVQTHNLRMSFIVCLSASLHLIPPLIKMSKFLSYSLI